MSLSDMKRILLIATLLVIGVSSASAAPKSVPVQLGSIYSAPIGTELFLQSGKNSIFISNPNSSTLDIQITAVDISGNQSWQRVIDSGADEVAMSATIDPLGNIWIAGGSAPVSAIESSTPISGIENPDSVVIESIDEIRSDLSNIGLWKISSTGELLGTFTYQSKVIPLINSISSTNSGLILAGSLESKAFILSATSSGIFGKPIYIGNGRSEINTVIRNSDGSATLFGSSAEKLAGKNLAGLRDGFLMKISKSGKITSIVRSSANRASRSWISGDSANLLSGPVITGKSIETAITKFNSSFLPTWTLRIPSTGVSTTLTANGNSYLAITSRSPITGIAGWRPVQPALLVITFDKKGVIKAATALPGLVRPISLHYSKERGVVGLAGSSDGTVSIFTLVSR